MNASHAEFDRLVDELEAGILSADDARRLEELSADPALRRKLVEYFFLIGELYWHESVEVPVGSSPTGDESATSHERFGTPSPLSTGASAGNAVRRLPQAHKSPRPRYQTFALAAAAVLVVSVAVSLYLVSKTARPVAPTNSTAVATTDDSATKFLIVATQNAVWNDSSTLPRENSLIADCKYQLTSGRIWLTGPTGELLFLEGTAAFSLGRVKTIELHRGVFAITSRPKTGEWTIRTPFGIVRDKGTTFSVRVEKTAMDIEVAEGVVGWTEDLGNTDSVELAPRQAVRISRTRDSLTARPISWTGDVISALVPPDASPTPLWRDTLTRTGHVATVFDFASQRNRFPAIVGTGVLIPVATSHGRTTRDVVPVSGLAREPAVQFRRLDPGNYGGAGLMLEEPFSLPTPATFVVLARFDGFPASDDPESPGIHVAEQLGTLLMLQSLNGEYLQWAFGADRRIELHSDTETLTWDGTAPEAGKWFCAVFTITASATSGESLVSLHLIDPATGDVLPLAEKTPLRGYSASATERFSVGIGADRDGARAYVWPGVVDELLIFEGTPSVDVVAGTSAILRNAARMEASSLENVWPTERAPTGL
ncbi:FecR domain-containing protein [Thermostilla marina]